MDDDRYSNADYKQLLEAEQFLRKQDQQRLAELEAAAKEVCDYHSFDVEGPPSEFYSDLERLRKVLAQTNQGRG